ncbi:Crp/Fnr family transcriptional regulator [Mangrovivirga sp. M17]|uniref:Crp/Fnr family transcriptional regulator n=1 Tax=Mangrovivirga halotolerans TaxID=2993936 RepID=A0ABT3RUS6_9BACT|nr:Crp/Fnr family transcriptional regulator [Mangrovivirga halotolerans]MCX2745411.1 Crp/Fnr family transcriptional regulator [Mangrovivirga halotolerans]
MEDLQRKIRSFTTVSDADMKFALQFYKKESVAKGSFLLKPDQYIDSFYFMKEGCVTYYTVDEGISQVMEFFTEGYFFTDLYAYIQEVPSHAYLEVMEDSTLYTISKKDVEKIFDYSHQLERFGRLSMQKAFINNFQRIHQIKNISNQERYLELLEKRPSLFQRVPQYLIASYLGLTPVGLSKIRKRLSKEAI